MLHGYSTRQIAAEVGVKFDTAKFHIKNIYKKLSIGSKSELFVRFGVELKNMDDDSDT